MTEDTKEAVINFIDKIGWSQDKELECLKIFIDKYGLVMAILKKEEHFEGGDALSDFLIFCTTKSFKTIKAVNSLIENGFFEDALILLRTVYESYITISYLIKNPIRVNDLLQGKLCYSLGCLEKMVDDRGKTVYKKFINTKNNKVIDLDITIAQIAQMGKYSIDGEIHKFLYKFLSEYIHPNMVAHDSYIDTEQGRFSYEKHDNFLLSMWLSVYLTTIILFEIINFFVIFDEDRNTFKPICDEGALNLIELFQFLSTRSEDSQKQFPLLIKRLELIK